MSDLIMQNANPVWDPNSGAALPAYLANALDEVGTNIADRMNVPSLSYEGKTWSIVRDGNRTKLEAPNSDGDMVPVPIMRAVILNYNGDRGRAYYPGVYNPAASAAPTCWSGDGKTPDASVREKQSTACNGCPMSVKGSKVQDGKEMVACSSHRMIAIAPAFALAEDPLRLKIAVTSDYDKDIVEHGWFAFRQYTDFLKSRGLSHTGLVVTKMKFDNNVAYPKLLFAIDRPLTPDEIDQVKVALKNPKVEELLSEKWTAAGVNGTPANDSDIKPHGLEAAYLEGWKAHPDSPGWSWKGTEVVKNDELAARFPEPEAPPIPEETAPAIPASEQVVEGKATPAAPPVETAAPAATTPRDAALADGWVQHPDSPPHGYKGSEVLEWSAIEAQYAPASPTPAAVAPAAPVSAPPAVATVQHDPIAAAVADGWIKHPDTAGYHYRGQEVVADGDLAAKYPPANGATGAPSAPAATPESGSPTSAAGQNAASSASPTDGAVPADVQALLDKWG